MEYQRINRNSTGQFLRARERMVHLSAPIIRNPAAATSEALGMFFTGPQFIADKGTTFNVGRNKAKHERRARRFGNQ
jgi:hypothetical protein